MPCVLKLCSPDECEKNHLDLVLSTFKATGPKGVFDHKVPKSQQLWFNDNFPILFLDL